jgi:hypothetical protein
VNASTCAVCTQPIGWTGLAWEHKTTGIWANTPVRHQASPVPKAQPTPVADRQDQDADQP